MSYTITKSAGWTRLKVGFHPSLPPRLRDMGGKWSPKEKVWLFDNATEEEVASVVDQCITPTKTSLLIEIGELYQRLAVLEEQIQKLA